MFEDAVVADDVGVWAHVIAAALAWGLAQFLNWRWPKDNPNKERMRRFLPAIAITVAVMGVTLVEFFSAQEAALSWGLLWEGLKTGGLVVAGHTFVKKTWGGVMGNGHNNTTTTTFVVFLLLALGVGPGCAGPGIQVKLPAGYGGASLAAGVDELGCAMAVVEQPIPVEEVEKMGLHVGLPEMEWWITLRGRQKGCPVLPPSPPASPSPSPESPSFGLGQ